MRNVQTSSLADLVNLYKVLYFLYKAHYEGSTVTFLNLQSEDELHWMNEARNLKPSISYLQRTDYVDDGLQLTGKGLKTTEELFRKFIVYMKRENSDELSTWIDTLERHKNNIWWLIHDTCFFIRNQTEVGKVFDRYLEDIGSIENIIDFEIEEHNLGSLIEDIFINLDELNRLFQHKFKCKLFCPPVVACSFMSRSTKRKNVDLAQLVTTIGSVIDEICHKEINALLGSSKNINGSIKKIVTILENDAIDYDPNTIEMLRTLHYLRDTTFPVHAGGSELITHLKKLQIPYPIDDPEEAALKILQILNSCLLDMKKWFS